jgi:hypothetical protein
MSISRRLHVGWIGVLVASALCASWTGAAAQGRYARVVEGILAAWEGADLVCLGEAHGREHDSELRTALVRQPSFARARI